MLKVNKKRKERGSLQMNNLFDNTYLNSSHRIWKILDYLDYIFRVMKKNTVNSEFYTQVEYYSGMNNKIKTF